MVDRTDNLTILRGFDAQGQVFMDSERVLRGVFEGQGERCRRVLDTIESNDLFRLGIVRTSLARDVELPGGPYDLVLEHEKVPFVSYPHEWPASMLKDAALFHLNLYLELAPYGLTIKDMHPHNILFDGAKPLFVDFTSIIPAEDLTKEEYLKRPSLPRGAAAMKWDEQGIFVHEMYARMFEPYFLLPLQMMRRGQYERAHRRMLETTLNASRDVISRREALGEYSPRRLAYEAARISRARRLAEPDPAKQRYFHGLRDYVAGIDVAPAGSAYASYYEEKDEAFGFEPTEAWDNKQRTVHEILARTRPRTVLDMAGNTGWFSILAAKAGARVVAFDIDEACADVLYRKARDENLTILSLVLDSTNPTPAVPAVKYENEPERCGEGAPLLLSATSRLKCELVMALAIIHHLALGQGQTLERIVDALDSFTGKHLVVEFVDKEDELVAGEPDFFPTLRDRPESLGWYTQDNFVAELRKRFGSVEVLPSHPGSRVVLLCSR